jgi:hypothetical protein
MSCSMQQAAWTSPCGGTPAGSHYHGSGRSSAGLWRFSATMQVWLHYTWGAAHRGTAMRRWTLLVILSMAVVSLLSATPSRRSGSSSGSSRYSRSYRSPRAHNSFHTRSSRSSAPRSYSSHRSHSPRAYPSHGYSRPSRAGGPNERDSRGRIKRSAEAKDSFKHQHPCPTTGRRNGACPGYVIDHVKPLECGGADDPSNMQWQTIAAGKAKDATERNCR